VLPRCSRISTRRAVPPITCSTVSHRCDVLGMRGQTLAHCMLEVPAASMSRCLHAWLSAKHSAACIRMHCSSAACSRFKLLTQWMAKPCWLDCLGLVNHLAMHHPHQCCCAAVAKQAAMTAEAACCPIPTCAYPVATSAPCEQMSGVRNFHNNRRLGALHVSLSYKHGSAEQ
jgi:hypothetical protein